MLEPILGRSNGERVECSYLSSRLRIAPANAEITVNTMPTSKINTRRSTNWLVFMILYIGLIL